MSFLSIILQFVIVFGLLIFFHELGHFLVSKAVGVEIEEFGFGYPPKMVKLFTWKGTDVTLNWIPFGGFVRPKGDDLITGSMASAPAWKRLLILLSGPSANFLIGILVLIIMFAAIGTPISDQVLISEISPNSPAQAAAIQPGDIILSIDGITVDNLEHVQTLIKERLGQELEMSLLRGENTLTVSLTPRVNPPEGQGAIGIGLSNPLGPMPFPTAVSNAFKTFAFQLQQTIMLPVNLIKGSISSEEARIVGIKGIFDMFSNATAMDASSPVAAAAPLPFYRMSLISTVSIALGLTNLLPIPALDGGQILLLLPELFFKKRIPQRIVNTLNSVFFFLLIILMVYITVQDFLNPIFQP